MVQLVTYIDLSTVDIANFLNIFFISNELRPLKAVYRSFEHHWVSKVLDQKPDKNSLNHALMFILSNIWKKCMTQNNIITGFKVTFLYHLNAQTFLEIAFAPSSMTSYLWWWWKTFFTRQVILEPLTLALRRNVLSYGL